MSFGGEREAGGVWFGEERTGRRPAEVQL
eukprot:COSAG02_NODE_25163_length_667_cov_0.838028_1_plen_28_part_01